MRRAAIALLACCVSVLAATAYAEQPRLRPTRDVDVTYRAAAPGVPQEGPRSEQRVRWQAASQLVRIDPPTSGLYVIIDYVARRMSVVREATKSVIEMAAPDSMAGVAGNMAGHTYVRRGDGNVAGQACTDWETMDRDNQPTLVCITEDGVLLRASSRGHTLVSAVSVRYVAQDPAAFQVPPDYVRRPAGAPR